MRRVAAVTGGSGGIGRCAAVELARRGFAVYELSRSGTGFDGVEHVGCDVTSEEQVRAAIDGIAEREGRLDLLVCCAGYGISGAVEQTAPEASRAQLDVNLFGADSAARAAIPHMRRGGGGRIVFVSSVAAVAPIPFQTWYSVSKAALNCYALALANELRPFGISVGAVMLGDVRTGFTAARKRDDSADLLYGGRVSRSVARMEKDERGGMSAERAGAAVVRFSLGRRPLAAVGAQYRAICVLIRLLPAAFVQRVLYSMYAK